MYMYTIIFTSICTSIKTILFVNNLHTSMIMAWEGVAATDRPRNHDWWMEETYSRE